MFNLFRKKKKIRVIKSRRLITLQKLEGMEDTFNIAMHFELEDFHSRVQTILNELHIYDDRVYVNAYKEYQDHYKVYDRVPDLLLYKIPVLFAIIHTRELRHRQIRNLLTNSIFQICLTMRLYQKSLD